MGLSESLDRLLDPNGPIGQAIRQGAFVAVNEIRDFAPFGWSSQLKKSITALPTIRDGKRLIGIITVESRDADLEDYAVRQNEESLRHWNPEGQKPLSRGFADYADSGGNDKERYESGYQRAVKDGRFFTYSANFIEQGMNSAKEDVLEVIRGAVAQAGFNLK